jgi:hypothetical protein
MIQITTSGFRFISPKDKFQHSRHEIIWYENGFPHDLENQRYAVSLGKAMNRRVTSVGTRGTVNIGTEAPIPAQNIITPSRSHSDKDSVK